MRQHDFSQYRFRCSQLGKLMINPKKKSESLSETTKTFLKEIFIEEVYGRVKHDTGNKFTEKGLITEEDTLTMMQAYYKKLAIKNQIWFQNEFVHGTPDLILPRKVVDAKSCWDIWTFGDVDGTNKDYYWQLQGYMWLTKKKKADLFYCLNNTPIHLVVDEKSRMMYKKGLLPDSDAMYDLEVQIEKNMTFDDMKPSERVKVYPFKFNQEDIDRLKDRILISRDFLNSLSL